jgi:diguanylate cyclase (GGDEF)-like protein
MAEVLQQCLRDTDYAFRFGGDEFCCLLQQSNDHDNECVANRIQESMTRHPTLAKHGISCSIGSANYLTDDTEQSLFSRADQALYGAKNAGRSCFQAA